MSLKLPTPVAVNYAFTLENAKITSLEIQ